MLTDILSKIDSLKDEFESLKPLKDADRERLWKKIRLEWNYNSNHMEGNTLTYGETELLLYKGETTGNHSIREYEEMKGHNLALQLVYDYAEDKDRELNESFIRDLNKIILKEPFWSPAITADRQPTKKQIIPGEYKSTPNSVRTATGETHHYPRPEETRIKMPELIEWYRQNSNLHPVILAAEMHYRLVSIHPFDDGNGRVSRLVMNYILIKHGYQPAIIKSKDKVNYIRCLNLADSVSMEAFHNYIAEQVEWSSHISIKAAKGQSIEEVDDLDKEIDLLNRDLRSKDSAITESHDLKDEILRKSFFPIMKLAYEKMTKLDSLFFKSDSTFYFKQGEGKRSLIFTWKTVVTDITSKIDLTKGLTEFYYEYNLIEFQKSKDTFFNSTFAIRLRFERYNYSIVDKRNHKIIEKNYSELFTQEEMEKLVSDGVRNVLETIKQHTGK